MVFLFASNNAFAANTDFMPTYSQWQSMFPKTTAYTAALNKGNIVKGSKVSDTITLVSYRDCDDCLPIPGYSEICVIYGGSNENKEITDPIVFGLSAAGTFYIDWGDGELYQIDRPNNTNLTFYTHKYPNGTSSTKPSTAVIPKDSNTFKGSIVYNAGAGNYSYSTMVAKVCISGFATGYSTTTKTFSTDYSDVGITVPVPTIIFSDNYRSTSNSGEWKVWGWGGGSLSDLFPVLGTGNANIPSFAGTFIGSPIFGRYSALGADTEFTKSVFNGINKTRNGQFAFTFAGDTYARINSSESNGIFAGISGSPSAHLFAGTFTGSRILNRLNSKMFGSLSGAVQQGTFFATFADASAGVYGQIPTDLFSGITGKPQTSSFSYMFYGDSGVGALSSSSTTPNNDYYIDKSLFSGLSSSGFTSGSKMNYMFKNTHLPYMCPPGRRKYETGFEADWGTFSDGNGTTTLLIPHSAIACEKCPLGTYSPSTNDSTTACVSCSAGTYANSTGRSACTSCPPGFPDSSAGNTDIKYCYQWYQFYPGKNASFYDGSAWATYTSDTSYKSRAMFYGQTTSANLFDYNSSNSTHTLKSAYISGSYKPTRTGYTFDGWYQSTGEVSGSDCPSGTSLSTSYGCTVPSSGTCPSGSYYLGGKCVPTSKVRKLTASTTITPTAYQLRIYAKWTAINYTISYTLNGGTQASGQYTSYNGDMLPLTLKNPTRTGYTFAGWCDNSGLTTNCSTTKTIAAGTTGSKTYYAKWTPTSYTVQLNTQGSSISTSGWSQISGTSNYKKSYTIETATFALPTPAAITGYTFGGWFTNQDYTSQVTQVALGSTGDKTYYAKWTPTTYYVQLNSTKNSTISESGWSQISGTSNYKKSYNITTATFTLPTPAAITGYTFDGWFTNTDYTSQVTQVALGSTGDKTYHAKWGPKVYGFGLDNNTADTVTNVNYTELYEKYEDGWYLDEETTSAMKIVTTSGIAENKLPIRTGYDFGGYYRCSGATGAANCEQIITSTGKLSASAPMNLSSGGTLYAKWTAKKYTVVYACGDGTGIVPEDGVVTYGANFTPATNTCTAPTGYSFKNWAVSDTNDTRAAGVAFKWMYTASKTFVAQWVPNTITIDWVNGGHGGTSTGGSTSCVYGTTFTTPAELSETGWTFGGWTVYGNTFDDAETVVCNFEKLGVAGNGETATVTAKWTANTINLEWDKNGLGNLTDNLPDTCKYGSAFNVKAELVEGGWRFENWIIDENGFTNAFEGGEQVVCDENNLGVSDDGATVTFKATWHVAPYVIKYNANGGSEVHDEQYDITDTRPNGYSLKKTTKTGYHFDGWCVYDTEQTPAVTMCSAPVLTDKLEPETTDNKYAYAKWTANTINLVWNENGHGTKPVSGTCVYDSTFDVEAALSATGWTFDGWKVNNITFTGGQQGVGCNIETLGVANNGENAMITAQWTPNKINLVWNNGGHGGNAPTTPGSCTYDLSFNTPEALEETGWIFKGWGINDKTFDAEGSVECNVENLDKSANNSTATITAQWEAIKYTITYHANGGEMSGANIESTSENNVYTQQYTVETSSVALTDPARSGYVFGGWYEDANFAGSPLSSPIESGGADGKYHRDISLYARWKVHCGEGYYLPANSEVCAECEEGYYCKGNEDYFVKYSEIQGRESCSAKTENGFVHSYSKQKDINSCFAILKLYGNGADNAESFDFEAYNSSTVGSDSCKEYNVDYPVCVSPYNGTGFVYALKPSVINNPTPFTRLGYEFLGWCPSSEPCGENTVQDTEALKGDKSLYAQWKIKEYDITYNDVLVHVDGTKTTELRPVPDENQSTYTIESSFNFATPSKPAVDEGLGWVFEGWYDDADFTNRVYGISAGQTEPKTYYAKWTPKNAQVDFYCDLTTIKSYSGQVGSELDVEKCGLEETPGWSCSGYPEFRENYNKIVIPNGGTVCRPGYRITYLGDGIKGTTNIMIGTDIKLVPDSYTSDLEVIFPSRKFMNNFKVRPGYSFTGWFYNYDGNKFSNKATGIARGSSGHKTVYAQWSPNGYRATYNCDSTTKGSITPETVDDVKYDTNFRTASNVNTCVKTGYVFDSWKVVRTESVRKSAGTDDTISVDYPFVWQYDEDKTFVAEWNPITYTVEFDGNGATDGNMNNQSFVYDEEQSLTKNTFIKDNYKFVGWCDDWNFEQKICAGTMYGDEQDVSNLTSETGTITLHAVWVLQDYAITYNVLKDEDSDTWQIESGLSPATYTVNSTEALPNSINATRPGYTFAGWCVDDDSYTNPNCEAVDMGYLKTDIHRDVDLYAKWELKQYNINYFVYYFDDAAWRTDEPFDDEYYTYNVEDNEKTLPIPVVEDGESFLGWCTVSPDDDPGCDLVDMDYLKTYIHRDVDLYAKWGYEITYVLNDGTGATESDTYNYGVGLSDLPEPTRDDGYTFVGWYKDAGLSGDKVESIPVDDEWGPITLYAKWAFVCDGKWVHVGDGENDKMCLSPVKPEGADAVLGIMVGNTPYYVQLSERGDNSKTISNNSNTKLHVQIGETVYNAHDASVK